MTRQIILLYVIEPFKDAWYTSLVGTPFLGNLL